MSRVFWTKNPELLRKSRSCLRPGSSREAGPFPAAVCEDSGAHSAAGRELRAADRHFRLKPKPRLMRSSGWTLKVPERGPFECTFLGLCEERHAALARLIGDHPPRAHPERRETGTPLPAACCPATGERAARPSGGTDFFPPGWPRSSKHIQLTITQQIDRI